MTEYGTIIKKNFDEMVSFLAQLNHNCCNGCPAHDFCDNYNANNCETAFSNWLNSKRPFSIPTCPYKPHDFCSHYNPENHTCALNILQNPIYDECDI